jgi:ribose transport system permease protein
MAEATDSVERNRIAGGTHGREDTGRPQPGRRWGLITARYAMIGLLLVLILAFSLLIPGMFFTFGNMKVLLTTQAVLAVLAIAMVVPLTVGQYDLSVAANMVLCEVMVIGLMVQSNLPTVLAILVVLAMSVGVGLINGLLVARAGINSLISTLGMSTVIIGLTQAYTGGRMINGEIASLVMLGRRTFLGLPFPVFYMIGIAIIAWYVLEQTPLGRYLYAIGGSKDAAKLAGINVRRLTLGSFMFSGLLAGIAGVMLAAKLGSGNPSAGSPLLMPALAAAFLGAAAIKVGTFNVAGTVVAVFTLATGVAGLQLMGAAWWIEPIFNGLALILAVGLTRFLRREEL